MYEIGEGLRGSGTMGYIVRLCLQHSLSSHPLNVLSYRYSFIFLLVMQIEGAFIQGLGWVALEELKWGDPAHKWISPGSLYTCGPGSYKIPSINDVPFKFNVSLLKVRSLPCKGIRYKLFL